MLACAAALIYMVWMGRFGEKNFSRKGVVKSGVDEVEEDDDIIIEEF